MTTSIYTGTNEERFRLLLRRLHASVFKELGMKKDGQSFRLIRQNGVLTQGFLVNFQKSAWNDRAELRFTVNLAKKTVVGALDPKFKAYDCDIIKGQQRLGSLAPQYRADKWWAITETTDIDALERELEQLLREAGLPWLGL